MKPVYLYIFEHETDFMSLDEPTRHDIVCVQNGVLTIYRVSGTKVETLCMNGPTGAPWEWIKVKKGVLLEAPPEVADLGQYHGLES